MTSRPIPLTVPGATADGASQEQFESISSVLAAARRLFKMDVVFVSEFVDGRRYFRHVHAKDGGPAPVVGTSDPVEDTYCYRIVRGRLPQVIPDTGALQETAGLAVTHAMKIGAYIGVPIVLEDGQVYGTLCCFSRAADPELSESAAVKLRAISLAVAAKLQGLPNVATVLPE